MLPSTMPPRKRTPAEAEADAGASPPRGKKRPTSPRTAADAGRVGSAVAAGRGAEGGSWRSKSIERFALREVPDGWKGAVAEASEDSWKRYYVRRCGAVEKRADVDDREGEGEVLELWEDAMRDRVEEFMAEGCGWDWTPDLGDLAWDGNCDLRSSEYYALVWSPYAIPRAIALEHRYHRRARWSSMEFGTTWGYRLVDFADETTVESDEYKTICSNHYEDEELMADHIKQSHMNKKTCSTLRKFLFGSCSDESKAVTCSDVNFWLLLFGSMGTTDVDLAEDPHGGNHGYEWRPDGEMRRKLYDLKAEEGGDGEGNPRGPFKDYYPSGCSWLKHRLLEITGTLGPVTKHYKPPTIEDAPGYSEEYRENMERKEEAQAKIELLKTPEGIKEFCEGVDDPTERLEKFLSLWEEARGDRD